ncbi:hypothetical protein Tco_0566698 [Tanacetum coccineum]
MRSVRRIGVGYDDVDDFLVAENVSMILGYPQGDNSSSGTKKYRGSNSSDGGDTGDGVKIVSEVIGSGSGIDRGKMASEAKRYLDKLSEKSGEMFLDEAGK